MPTRWIRLESPAIVTRAMRATGLADFGGMRFSEPLEVLCRSLDREARLHAAGRREARRVLVDLMSTRARIAAARAPEPDPTDPPPGLAAPIVVTGLPRTGLSWLHQLLALHPSLRSLTARESDDPVGSIAAPGPEADTKGISERRLLAVEFASMDHEVEWHVPAFAEWYDAADLTPGYAGLRSTLQMLTPAAALPPRHWILRSWQHLEQLGPLLTAFPEAVVVQVHRNPEAALRSWVPTVAARRALWSDEVDSGSIAKYWTWRLGVMTERNLDHRAQHTSRFVDIEHDELHADPFAVTTRIWDALGLETDQVVLARLRSYCDRSAVTPES